MSSCVKTPNPLVLTLGLRNDPSPERLCQPSVELTPDIGLRLGLTPSVRRAFCISRRAAMNVNLDTTSPRELQLSELRALPRDMLAQTLSDLDLAAISELFDRIGDEGLADLIANLDPYDAAHLLRNLSRPQAAEVLEEMAPDDAADVVDELDPQSAEAILVAMAPEEAQELRELLVFSPTSAGGIMTRSSSRFGPRPPRSER